MAFSSEWFMSGISWRLYGLKWSREALWIMGNLAAFLSFTSLLKEAPSSRHPLNPMFWCLETLWRWGNASSTDFTTQLPHALRSSAFSLKFQSSNKSSAVAFGAQAANFRAFAAAGRVTPTFPGRNRCDVQRLPQSIRNPRTGAHSFCNGSCELNCAGCS
jgi:hypothetical protein